MKSANLEIEYLAPEHRTQVHNDFVSGICDLLVAISSSRNRFDITETCLEGGERAATVEVGDHLVNFDILLIHVAGNVRTHYYCECKTRRECSGRTDSDLKRHLKIFLRKAYQTMDSAQSRYGENYGFLFISDVPFGVADGNVNFSYVKEALTDISTLDENKLNHIVGKVRILLFSDWFVGIFR